MLKETTVKDSVHWMNKNDIQHIFWNKIIIQL